MPNTYEVNAVPVTAFPHRAAVEKLNGGPMPNTLGLDDDLDGVELVQLLERAFDLTIHDKEAEQIITVGDIYDLLVRKIPANESSRKCASAMAFYRLRQGIRALGFDERLTPSSDIRFLERDGAKEAFKSLEKQTGLLMPRLRLSAIGRIGCLAAPVFSSIVAVAAYKFDYVGGGAAIGLAFLSLVAFGWIIISLDRGRLTEDCFKLADLAKKTTALNYGRLVKLGAGRRNNEIWDNLVELVSDYCLSKSEITRDTFCLKSQMEKSAAA